MDNELRGFQIQRDEHIGKIQQLEASLRHTQRQLSELETALSRKHEETLELTGEKYVCILPCWHVHDDVEFIPYYLALFIHAAHTYTHITC